MTRISIITDSTSDLPHYTYQNYDLHVIPLSVVFGSKTYIDDGINIKPEEFYKMMQSSTEMPKASQPTPGNFMKVYGSLIKEGKEIISIHISRKLSGTLNSADLAAKQFEDDEVNVIDSEVVHMSCGFMALKAAKMAKDNAKKEDIINEIINFRNKINAFFLPKSLDNLIKGGRINKIQGKFANFLEIKPILTLKDGEVSLFKNTRKWELAKKEVLNSMEDLIKGQGKLVVSIGDVFSKDDADSMQDEINKRFKPSQIIRTKIGIVVGSHLGIGGLNVTFFEDDDF
ncbi:MAG: DegV family protein [Actinobacteria bacterium]|nr:DegV family protein [Cyanobacteriota bacterium]MCL5772457.1 DegV family protein [Actinomycetota bacterium]